MRMAGGPGMGRQASQGSWAGTQAVHCSIRAPQPQCCPARLPLGPQCHDVMPAGRLPGVVKCTCRGGAFGLFGCAGWQDRRGSIPLVAMESTRSPRSRTQVNLLLIDPNVSYKRYGVVANVRENIREAVQVDVAQAWRARPTIGCPWLLPCRSRLPSYRCVRLHEDHAGITINTIAWHGCLGKQGMGAGRCMAGGRRAAPAPAGAALDGCRPPVAHQRELAHSLVQSDAPKAPGLPLQRRLLHAVLQNGCKATQCGACCCHGGLRHDRCSREGAQNKSGLGTVQAADTAQNRPPAPAGKWAGPQDGHNRESRAQRDGGPGWRPAFALALKPGLCCSLTQVCADILCAVPAYCAHQLLQSVTCREVRCCRSSSIRA